MSQDPLGRHLPLLDQILLDVRLHHDRTSCGDLNPVNGYTTDGRGGFPRCGRCGLLKAKRDGLILGVDYWLAIDINFKSVDT